MRTTNAWRRRLIGMLGAGSLAAGLTIPGSAPAAAVTPPADMVVRWNEIATTTITGTAAQGPTVAYLHLAMVQGAVYDAVNGIDGGHEPYDGGHEPYLGDPSSADPGDSMLAASATAAYRVLRGIFSTNATIVSSLDGSYAASMAGLPPGASTTGGVQVGEEAAAAMLTERTGDGRSTMGFSLPGPPEGFGPGQWRRTADPLPTVSPFGFEPAPGVGNVEPFVIRSAAALRSNGPNPLRSLRYTIDYIEVKRLGALNSTVRSEDQTYAALFWQANGATLFNTAFRDMVQTQGLDIVDAARLLAMGNLAGADGAIACWNDKYTWNFWRPITAIHLAATDGNPATVADATWQPLFATPPFPEHPSGHTCISGAVVRTLQAFFGKDKVPFTTTGAFGGVTRTRSFDRLSQAIREIVDARVWAGIHFRTADRQGQIIGLKVAHQLLSRYFEEC